jgi:hypothetical protein
LKQLKAIKNKKVRGFYEEQNRRLDDWLEVDMVVKSVADDVIDSMDPQDLDHDGVAEDRGPLGGSGENVECFLPQDEREKRRKALRNAKWAINVSVHYNLRPITSPKEPAKLFKPYCQEPKEGCSNFLLEDKILHPELENRS